MAHVDYPLAGLVYAARRRYFDEVFGGNEGRASLRTTPIVAQRPRRSNTLTS